MDLGDFRYILCPGTGALPHEASLYNEIYSKWFQLWQDTMKGLGIDRPLYSESFTRQHYFGSLYYQGKCVALCSYRWTNAKELSFAGDSYFSTWYPLAIRHLKSRGDRIVICGNFCLDPNYRGRIHGISVKDLLMGMVVETFMNSPSDCLAGAVRVDRKMNDLTVRWGAKLIAENVDSGLGDRVDMIGFFRDIVEKTQPHELRDLARKLWVEKQVLGRNTIEFDLEQRTSIKRTA